MSSHISLGVGPAAPCKVSGRKTSIHRLYQRVSCYDTFPGYEAFVTDISISALRRSKPMLLPSTPVQVCVRMLVCLL